MKITLFERIKLAFDIIKYKDFYAAVITDKDKNGSTLCIATYSNIDKQRTLKKLVDNLQTTLYIANYRNRFKLHLDNGLYTRAECFIYNHLLGYSEKERAFAYNYFLEGAKDLLWQIELDIKRGEDIKKIIEEYKIKE